MTMKSNLWTLICHLCAHQTMSLSIYTLLVGIACCWRALLRAFDPQEPVGIHGTIGVGWDVCGDLGEANSQGCCYEKC